MTLVLGPPDAGIITYSSEGPVVAGLGINLAAGSNPLILTLKEHGTIVRKEWFAIADAANRLAAIIEGGVPLGELERNV